MRIAVVGTGYVGLVTGVVLADLGNNVICVDKDAEKLAKLRDAVSPIYEPGIEEILRRTIAEKKLTFTDSISEATKQSEIVFIAVGTPALPNGHPDMSGVKQVAADIGKAIEKHTIVVNKSTVPVGSGDMVEQIIREQGVSEDLFDVVSNPEFLREGSAIQDTLHPDRVVIGSKRKEIAEKLVELYAPLEAPVVITDLNTAELIKYASNSFLAMKISFINAISRICELANANVGDIAKGMGMDARIGNQFLQAGLGWGGSCFPKDVLGLIKTGEALDYDFRLLKEVWEVNEDQTKHFMARLESKLGGFAGKTICLWGLAFKPNTDDIRDAKSLVMIDLILQGGGSVRAYDPVAMDNVREIYPGLHYATSPYEAAEGADAVVLVTEWNEFKQLDLRQAKSVMKGDLLFDGRRIYSKHVVEGAGLRHFAVGVAE